MVDHKELFSYSLGNMMRRKMRSWLTVLGIVIGIAAIVTLISVAQGLTNSINDQLKAFGTNAVVVVPGDISQQLSISGGAARPPSTGRLFKNDVDRIKRVSGTEYVSSALSTRASVDFKDKQATMGINGVEPSIFQTANKALEIEQGRFLADTDRHTAVIGNTIAYSTFGTDKVQVGSVLVIGSENTKFRVVGVLKKSGSSGGNGDSALYVPIEDARELAGSSISKNEVSGIRFLVKDGFDVKEVVDNVNYELLSAHHVREEDKDFSFLTSEFLQQQVGTITALLTLFLGGVAGISLIVGGVGIANTMFMSVLERTREIGILKAIGADSRAIQEAFLIESGMIGLFGGIVGVSIGFLFSLIAGALGVPTAVGIELVLFAIFFSFTIGIISGYVPAVRASRLPAIEALRYE
ncbi:MacB-like periplasmic core domain protein [Candidatus Anstonella stagnisolia]|nr:MacB-like periplasmic core domain protein [Candidatus Anstonella stagnisolia]